MMLQPEKSNFILAKIKEVEAHEARSHWTLMKNIEVNNKHKNKYGNLKTILSFWYFKCKILPYEIKTKTLCTWSNSIMGS